MSSETTMIAEQCRLHEWAAQIRECQGRPAGMSIVSWCASQGITKSNYYYRLRRVRKACLEQMEDIPRKVLQQIVPVNPEILQEESGCADTQSGLDISIHGYSIHVTGATSMPLLEKVLKVARNA